MNAAAVARKAMDAVQDRRRDAWLALFADDARVEDPVGHLPEIRGSAALGQFWDQAFAALGSVEFDVTRQWEAGNEAMLLATVSVVGADGVKVSYDGTFDYVIDEAGQIVSMRAFWDLPAVVAAFAAG